MFFKGAISADSHILEPPACFSEHIETGCRALSPTAWAGMSM